MTKTKLAILVATLLAMCLVVVVLVVHGLAEPSGFSALDGKIQQERPILQPAQASTTPRLLYPPRIL